MKEYFSIILQRLQLPLWLFGSSLFGRFGFYGVNGFFNLNALSRNFGLHAVQNGAGNQFAVELNGANGVVVARNREVNVVRVGVGIGNADNRNAQLLASLTAKASFGVSMTNSRSG